MLSLVSIAIVFSIAWYGMQGRNKKFFMFTARCADARVFEQGCNWLREKSVHASYIDV